VTGMENKVLIIDDDEKLCKLLKEYLEENGFKVIALADGSDVKKTLQKESLKMIILDIMLPGKNGLEVLKEIRMDHTIPVIMLTAKETIKTAMWDLKWGEIITCQSHSTRGSYWPG